MHEEWWRTEGLPEYVMRVKAAMEEAVVARGKARAPAA
jgi:hypothetical protein